MPDPQPNEELKEEAAGGYKREIENQDAAQHMGTNSAPSPRREGSLGEQDTEETQETNPKQDSTPGSAQP